MKDYTAMQLYDLQRKSSLEICKRMLEGEIESNQIDHQSAGIEDSM